MASAPGKKQIPLRPGMFQMPARPGEAPRLVGSRCRACGELFAARRAYCANCSKPELEEVLLSATGEIRTFTIVRQQPPGSLMVPPYVIASVRLDDGVGVQSLLTDIDPDQVRIGMPVEIVLKAVKEDEAGNELVATFFRPRKTA